MVERIWPWDLPGWATRLAIREAVANGWPFSFVRFPHNLNVKP